MDGNAGNAGTAALKYATSQIRVWIQMQSRFELQVLQEGGGVGGVGRGLWPGESLTAELEAKLVTDPVSALLLFNLSDRENCCTMHCVRELFSGIKCIQVA